MKKIGLQWTALLAAIALVFGCAMQKPQVPEPVYQTPVLSAQMGSRSFGPKVDDFVVILDASESMSKAYKYEGYTKFSYEKTLIHRMNEAIPAMKMNAAMRSFGHGSCLPDKKTLLLSTHQPYSKAVIEKALQDVPCTGGTSPLACAIKGAGEDLEGATGRTAVLVFSDGLDMDNRPVTAAKALADEFGDRLCVYTVHIGQDPKGVQLLGEVASAASCGMAFTAEEIASGQGMADFVKTVFIAGESPAAPRVGDSDGDGVLDDMDQCPNTPRGVIVNRRGCPLDSDADGVYDSRDRCPDTPRRVKVDARGCPFDTDGDGVYDYMDVCPKTPKGAKANARGCWVIKNIHFDTGKATIKTAAYPALDEVIDVFRANPVLKAEIQGHTDNVGSAAMNQALSEKRAKAVFEYLVKCGTDPDRLSFAGYGYSQPISSNDTAEGRAMNRRVQLKPIY
ncbi:MAG: OmpA family protein [Deltaproteobacteria bacterium]|nr:OmpA family protein [Deltaproteobacteria bacterium]